MMDINAQLKIIKRGAVDILSEEELRLKLKEGRPLIVKAGFDPTAADLHLGHTVLLRKLRQFQDLGHRVKFLIGDFTARIGDPTGRSQLRKQLSKEEVNQNSVTYCNQVSRVLDMEKLEVVFNSHWFEKMRIADMLSLTSHATVSQMLARADFRNRHSNGQDISLLELMYPLLQGYDSVELKADIEIGGSDQIFNLLVGRELQKDYGIVPQAVLTMPLLEGTDGVQKMSKSYDNYIGINEPAGDMFGKLMSISDELMFKYYELLTDEDMNSVRLMHPKDAKVRLAKLITGQYHGNDAGEAAADEFGRVFSRKEVPQDVPVHKLARGGERVIEIIIARGLANTKNEARRLLEQGGVSFNGERISTEEALLSSEGILKVGKRRFLKLQL
ncbi:MAG: tyrosine--tRNA ligase [Candidatus Omnitrophota bacterium]|jgi:tyrosyl-tRNA synthetase